MTAHPLRNHLLATHSTLVHGLVSPMVGRLGDHLRTYSRPYLTVEDAQVHDLEQGTITRVPSMMLQLEVVLWAHEFVALAGDEHRRKITQPEERGPVRVRFADPRGLECTGLVANTVLSNMSRFFVLLDPVTGAAGPLAEKHADAMRGLHYVLINRAAPMILELSAREPVAEKEEADG